MVLEDDLNDARYNIIYCLYANVLSIKEWKNKYKTYLFKLKLDNLKQIHEENLKLRLINMHSKITFNYTADEQHITKLLNNTYSKIKLHRITIYKCKHYLYFTTPFEIKQFVTIYKCGCCNADIDNIKFNNCIGDYNDFLNINLD